MEVGKLWDWFNGVSQTAWRITPFLFNKEKSRFRLESLLTTRHPYFFVLAARKTYFITARARKKKRTARMLAKCSQRPFDTPNNILPHVCPNCNVATATVKPDETKLRLLQRANSLHSLHVLQNLSSIHCHYFFLSGLCFISSYLIIFAISSGSKTDRRNSRLYPGLWAVHIFPERLVLEILSAVGLYHHNAI